jgi:hypothetical protein
MVEFAFILPFLLVLALGLIDYSRFLETTNNVLLVVRDAARYASINPTGLVTDCPAGPASGCLASDKSIEGVIQAEAWSLTLPEGGINVLDLDCTWTGTAPNQSPTPPSPPSACITVAVYPVASAGVPNWSPSTAACSHANCGLSSAKMPHGTWQLVPCGYWTVASGGAFITPLDYSQTTCETQGALITVTIAATFAPITPPFDSLMTGNLTTSGTYAMVVTPVLSS